MSLPKVLFLVEGNTDIRFVTGLSEISQLTMAVPAASYASSGLRERVLASGAVMQVSEIGGGRLLYQFSSLLYLLRHARDFEVILCQEVLRGALNGTLVGALSKTPTLTYMAIAPVEYFRCRRQRGQIGPLQAWIGEIVIRFLMTVNGLLATRCVALGGYLQSVAAPYCTRTVNGLYYGVDTNLYRPATENERLRLREELDLPPGKFVIFLSSRVSHEKDPETVLQAAALARQKGLDAVVINLGGGYKDFLKLAADLRLDHAEEWVLGRPAAHPMGDLVKYYQVADCVAQASLEEGLGISPLEALATGTPAVCTAVGGLKNLNGHARLTSKRDPVAMSEQFLWIAANRDQARAQALTGREYVIREWDRKKAFSDLAAVFEQVIREN